MNNNIIEIIGLLIQKMLQDDDPILDEEDIIQELVEMGYDIKDIDYAFELIYNSADIIEEENFYFPSSGKSSLYNRVFTRSEKLYISNNIQGILLKLFALSVLTPREYETIVGKVIQNNFDGNTETSDLWDFIEEVIKDNKRLELITDKMPEFKKYIPKHFKYVN